MLLKSISILPKKRKIEISFVLIFILFNSLLEMLSIGMLLPLISYLMNPSITIDNNFFFNNVIERFFSPDGADQSFNIFLIIFLLIFIFKNISVFLTSIFISVFYLKVEKGIGVLLLREYLNSSMSFLSSKSTSELIRNTHLQAGTFAKRYFYELIFIVSEGVVFIFLTSLLLYNFFFETVILVLFLFFVFALYIIIFRNKIYSLSKISQNLIKERYKSIQENFNSITELKIYSLQDKLSKVFSKLIKSSNQIDIRLTILNIAPRFILEILIVFILISVLFYYLNSFGNLAEAFLPITIFSAVLLRLSPSINKIIRSIQIVRAAKPVVNNILSEIDKMKESNYSQSINKNIQIKFEKQIELIDVSFFYEKDKFIFQNINLKINKGEKIGLTGNSGQGKTTLIEVIIGLYQTNKGKILIDGTDISENYKSWMGNIGFIPQKVILLDDTIANNIAFMDVKQNLDKKTILEIMKKVDLDQYLIDEAFTKNVGEGGMNISGGQRQKIAIARALYKKKNFLILDEATKGLDKISEKKVIQNLINLDNNLTILLISHDNEILSMLNKTYKLEKNNLIENSRTI